MVETITVYIATIALFASVPIILDIISTYLSVYYTRKLLIQKASADGLKLEELKQIVKESRKELSGIQGLARAVMALSVIVILGIATFHVLVKGVIGIPENLVRDVLTNPQIANNTQIIAQITSSSAQIVDKILTMLATILASITAFYFGIRAAEKPPEEKSKPPEGK